MGDVKILAMTDFPSIFVCTYYHYLNMIVML